MNIIEDEKKYLFGTYARQEIVIEKGKGATCYDENGKEYIDLGSGIGVNSLGYCDDVWCNAVSSQLSMLQHTSNLYYTKPMVELAKALCAKTGYSKVFFGNSGAEANEAAIKLARKYSSDKYGQDSGRNRIVTLVNSFHGRTVTTLSATGQEVFHKNFHPFTEGFDYIDANDFDSLKDLLGDGKHCAVMFEFIQGEGGVIPLDADFVKNMFEYCINADILLIADEVQTGIGRTGKLLAGEHYGVKPDIVTLAKGLGGGLPIGAVLAVEGLADTLSKGDHGTTYGGNPVVCAGANAVLKRVTEDDFLTAVREKGDYIRNQLADCKEIERIDGIGLMLGIKLKTKSSAEVVKLCLKKGCILLTAKEKVRLLPPLNITEGELSKAVAILKEIITKG